MTPTSIMKVSFPSVKMVKNKLEIVPIYGFQNQFPSSLPLITSSCKAVTTCLNSHWKNNFPDGKKNFPSISYYFHIPKIFLIFFPHTGKIGIDEKVICYHNISN